MSLSIIIFDINSFIQSYDKNIVFRMAKLLMRDENNLKQTGMRNELPN